MIEMGVNGIYGLSGSGIDVESMVKVGMMSKQNEYDKMYKKETKMAWQKEAYSTVYTDLMNFGMNKLTDYKLQSNMNAMAATSSDTSSVAVTANGSAVAMSHSVKVNSVTTNAYLMSTNSITRTNTDSTAKDSMKLKDVVFSSLEASMTEEGKYILNGGTGNLVNGDDVALSFKLGNGTDSKEITFTYKELAEGKTLNDLASEIKKQGLGITASYDSVNDSFSLYNTTGGTENKISLEAGNATTAALFNNLHLGQSSEGTLTPVSFSNASLSGTVKNANTSAADSTDLKDVMFPGFADNADGTTYSIKDAEGNVTSTVNGADTAFSFDVSDGTNSGTIAFTYNDLASGSLATLAQKINDSGAGVTASYADGKFSITNSTADTPFSIKANDDGAAKLFQQLGLGTDLQSGDELSAGAKMEIAGTDGSITVDGRTYNGITTGKTTIAGVTYNLLNKTDSAVTVTVTQDTDAIIDRVKQFVEDYNAMLDELQDKYHETVYSDYGVLTKSQEESMTKEQVEKWNEKAKSGLLNHDKYIGDIISKMREALATPVDGVTGKYNSAFNIGITTTNDRGHIKLDDEKLKKVLAEEPNSV
ncbi:MAG: flagellar filament capping protein FliD, partial [Selenomonadaceae bacterium]|nr:flagellar filament capping protein FliD [Selenomonadaceae bacterium]